MKPVNEKVASVAFDDIIKAKIDYINGVVSEDLSYRLIDTKDIKSVDKQSLENELAFIDSIYQLDMPTQMPSSQLDERFYAMLANASNSATNVEEAQPVEKVKPKPPTLLASIQSLFTQLMPAPVWQAAALVSVFAVGYQTNTGVESKPQLLASNAQVEQLNQQVSSLNALMAMSMINSDSASKRLAGIEYSAKVSTVDSELNQALLQLLRSDNSTSIRLSALNAMANQGRKLGLSEASQQALLDSLTAQRTMVQVNIIAVLLELGNKSTQQQLLQLASNDALNEEAKSFLTDANNQAI